MEKMFINLFDILCLLNENQYISICISYFFRPPEYIFNGMVCDYHGDFDYEVCALRHSSGGNLKIMVFPR